MTKLYIRTNESSEIIHAFTEKFEQPQKDDILYADKPGRHVQDIAPELMQLIDFKTKEYRLKFIKGKVQEKTVQEMQSAVAYIKRKALQDLSGTDRYMARITEDIFDTLIAKNILKKSDLPADVIEKIDSRKALREKI